MKVLVDSSVWIDHMRLKSKALVELLVDKRVVTHTYIMFELASGNLGKNWAQILFDLSLLERPAQSTEAELLDFMKTTKIMGHGLSFVDIELLWAAMSANCRLWTRDKKLNLFCKKYSCGFDI